MAVQRAETERPSGAKLLQLRGAQLHIKGTGEHLVTAAIVLGGALFVLAVFERPYNYGVAAFFALLALYRFFSKAEIVLDLDRGQAVVTWGLLGRKRHHPLSSFSEVCHGREVRGSGDQRRTVYPIKLRGADAQLELLAPPNAFDSRHVAEEVGKHLGLDIVNYVGGMPNKRRAGELDTPLVDRMREQRGAEPIVKRPAPASVEQAPAVAPAKRLRAAEFELPEPGKRLRGRYRLSPDALRIELPLQLYGGDVLVPFLGALIFLVPVGSCAVWSTTSLLGEAMDASRPVDLTKLPIILGGLFIGMIPVVLLVRAGLRRVRRRVTVQVTPRGVMVSSKIGDKSEGVESMTIAELEELGTFKQLHGAGLGLGGVCMRSDKKEIIFGQGLRKQEIIWILQAIEGFLDSIE